MVLCRLVHTETLDVWKVLVVLVEENTSINLVRVELLYTLDVLLEMVIYVRSRYIEIAVTQYYEYLVIIRELSKQLSVLCVVETVYIRVIPYLLTAKCRVAM